MIMTDKLERKIIRGCKKCGSLREYSPNDTYPISCRLGNIKLLTAMRCNRNTSNESRKKYKEYEKRMGRTTLWKSD